MDPMDSNWIFGLVSGGGAVGRPSEPGVTVRLGWTAASIFGGSGSLAGSGCPLTGAGMRAAARVVEGWPFGIWMLGRGFKLFSSNDRSIFFLLGSGWVGST